MTRGGYHVLAPPVEFDGELPLTITEGVQLARATDPQLEFLKSGQAPLDQIVLMTMVPAYEGDFVPDPNNNQVQNYVPGAREAWRYHVIEFELDAEHSSDRCRNVIKLAYLMEPTLLSLFHGLTTEPFGKGDRVGVGWEPESAEASLLFTSGRARIEVAQIDASYVAALQDVEQRYAALDARVHSWLKRAIDIFCALRSVPHHRSLAFLGAMSTIEALLTHQPSPSKNLHDSLTHQVRKKMCLIDARLRPRLDYGIFPQLGGCDGVWDELYKYRSAIAHGGEVDFARGRGFGRLTSPQIAYEFVAATIRRIIRDALREPDFYRALQSV